MKVILVPRRNATSLSLDTSRPLQLGLLLVVAAVPLLLGVMGTVLVMNSMENRSEQALLAAWQQEMDRATSEVEHMSEQVELELVGLTVRMAELQARVLRLDALGQRVASNAKFDNGEFDFSRVPAVGGPVAGEALAQQSEVDVRVELDELQQLLVDRERQLALLEQQLDARKTRSDTYIAGRPIRRGWMSSAFGQRTDPFNGQQAWHEGVDFAGKEGADVVAVAGGVVTYSGKRYGYGQMVEINHGDGYTTLYAHNRDNLVQTGDTVTRGQTIAKMGSSGRSTGPHVHFEVSKWGEQIDPVRYINRKTR